MKRIVACIVIVIMTLCSVVFAAGCEATGKYLVVMSVSNQTDTSFSMSYESFDGYRVYKMKLSKTTEVNIRFETESGRLDYSITDEDGEVVLQQDNVSTMGFGINFSRGTYTVRLTADHHKGSYSFSW